MSRIIEIITPEQVAIRYELAGFGSRALAALFDSLLQFGLLFLVALIFALAFGGTMGDIYSGEKLASSFLIGIFILLLFLRLYRGDSSGNLFRRNGCQAAAIRARMRLAWVAGEFGMAN